MASHEEIDNKVRSAIGNLLNILSHNGKMRCTPLYGGPTYERHFTPASVNRGNIVEIHRVKAQSSYGSNNLELHFGASIFGKYTSNPSWKDSLFSNVEVTRRRDRLPLRLKLGNEFTVNSFNLIEFDYSINEPVDPWNLDRTKITKYDSFKLTSSKIDMRLKHCKGGFSCDPERVKNGDHVEARTATLAGVNYDFQDPVSAAKFMVSFDEIIDGKFWDNVQFGTLG